MLKKLIIAVIALLALGGLIYKALNPSHYKHPLHQSR